MTPPAKPTTTPKTHEIVIDPDVAAWITAVLFPAPETGRQGAQINGVPGTPEFDAAVEIFTRARAQLGG